MSYVTLLWSAAAASVLLLSLLHCLIWTNERHVTASLAFAIAGAFLAAGILVELGMLHAGTPQEWVQWLGWMQVPGFAMVCGIGVFLHLYISAQRRWLLAAAIALGSMILMIDLFSAPSFHFERVDSIARIPFLGEHISVVERAATGDHQWFALLVHLLFPAYVLDAGVTLWRRNCSADRRVALFVVGPVLLSAVLSVVLTQLVLWRIVVWPMLLISPFLIAFAAMAVEISRDVIRAARLARDLRESEQRLDLAADVAGAGLLAWDAESRRIWVSERARAILGLDPEGNIDIWKVLRNADPADAWRLSAALEQALCHGGEHAVEFRLEMGDAGTRWVAAHGTVELDAKGRSRLARGVVRDVTHGRAAEAEITELRRKLAHAGRVTMLGQLASALAHELNQPLSAIQQNAETAQILLPRESLDIQELRDIVADVHRDVRRAVEVVQRLRSWLKLGSVQMETVWIYELAHDVLALVRGAAVIKHVAVECAVPRSLPPVLADRIQLSQVLLNLVMNAIEAIATVPGEQRCVRIDARIGPAGCCEVAVIDSGPGIPVDQLDRIFEPFVTAKPDGMGMGLSISRTIVEAHGGRLWAENGVYGGATFCFTVPIQDRSVEEYVLHEARSFS